MEIKIYKTNLKCEGCVAKVKPLLDECPKIISWKADISGNVKTLKLLGEELDLEFINGLLSKAGYFAESLE